MSLETVLIINLEGLRDLSPEEVAEELKDLTHEEVVQGVGDYIFDYYDANVESTELEFLWSIVSKDAVVAYLFLQALFRV